MLQRWQEDGGVMIIGYEMYRNLAQGRNVKSRKLKEIFNKALVDPGKVLTGTERSLTPPEVEKMPRCLKVLSLPLVP